MPPPSKEDILSVIEESRRHGAKKTLLEALRHFVWYFCSSNKSTQYKRLFFEGDQMCGAALVSYYPGRNTPSAQFHAAREKNVLVLHQIAMLPIEKKSKTHIAVLGVFQDPTLRILDAVVVEAVLSEEFLASLERRGWKVQDTNAIMYREVAEGRVESGITKVQKKAKAEPKEVPPPHIMAAPPAAAIVPLPHIPPAPPAMVRCDGPEAYGWENVQDAHFETFVRLPEDEAEIAGFGFPSVRTP